MDEILELLWPDRVDSMGFVFGLGLATEEYNIFPNRWYLSLMKISTWYFCLNSIHFF
jgi:hypothetical protein